ncbi:MAG: hypothetical protein K1W33_02295 [Clostridia bacterium]|nr:hypothetical protein [Clostridia bacterium]
MNQILDYTPNKNSKKSSSSSDTVVRVFAVLLVIFSLCLLGSGLYSIFKNKESEKNTNVKPTYATINAVQEGDKAIISVTHDKVIESMVYRWNSDAERSIKGDGKKTIEKELDLPAGENTLYIKVIDVNGVETSSEEKFTAESGLDIMNPVISLNIVNGEEEKMLKITATDETKIDFLTYRWNDEEEVKVEASEDNSKEIVTEIPIMRGTNDITIVAVDSENNTTTETKSYTGLTQPEIVVTLSEDGSTLIIKTTHENGVKKISYKLNDKPYEAEFEGEQIQKEVEFTQGLDEGYNRLVLTVTSVDDTETVFDGECEYAPSAPEEEEQQPDEQEQQPEEETSSEETEE